MAGERLGVVVGELVGAGGSDVAVQAAGGGPHVLQGPDLGESVAQECLSRVRRDRDHRPDRSRGQGDLAAGQEPAQLVRHVETVCRRLDPDYRRLNVEILGSTDAFPHCHIWPRYEWEPPELVGRPVWLYDARNWRDPTTALVPHTTS